MPETAATRLADGIRYLRGGSLERAWHCFEQVAEHARDPAMRSEAYRRLADVKRRRAEWADALALTAEAQRIAREHGLRDEAAAALNVEGTVHLQQGEFRKALEIYQQALEVNPGAHQRGLIAQNLGTAFAQKGLHNEAAEWYARSSSAFRVAGKWREEVLAMVNQGSMLMDQGKLAEAESSFAGALERIIDLASRDAELYGLIEMNLAETLGLQGRNLDRAMDLALSATGHFVSSGNQPYRVASHRVIALISERQGDLETAISALQRGAELARQIGSGPELASIEREISRLRTRYRGSPPE